MPPRVGEVGAGLLRESIRFPVSSGRQKEMDGDEEETRFCRSRHLAPRDDRRCLRARSWVPECAGGRVRPAEDASGAGNLGQRDRLPDGCPNHNRRRHLEGPTYTDAACPTGDPGDRQVRGLLLAKTGPTSNVAAAVAEISGVRGKTLPSSGTTSARPAAPPTIAAPTAVPVRRASTSRPPAAASISSAATRRLPTWRRWATAGSAFAGVGLR